MKRKLCKILTVLLAMTMLLSACGGGGAADATTTDGGAGDSGTVSQSGDGESGGGEARTGGTLRYALSAEPSQLEPALAQGTAKRVVLETMYRGLVTYSPDGELVNDMAADVQVSDDGLTYTVSLREVRFHNGDAMTAEDVQFTFERLLDPATGATFRQELSVIASVEVVDESTVAFHLSDVCAPFLHYLALPESCIVSKSDTQAKGGDLDNDPMGTGPFKFVEWNKGQNLIVERNDDYYKAGKPMVDQIVFSFYADDDARANALRSGEADIIDYVAWKDIPSFENDPSFKLDVQNGPIMDLSFNTNFEPFSDPRVRQAISYAVNRDNVINMAFNGRSTACYGFIFEEGFLGYNPSQTSYYSYDPDKARALLAEAGYADGFSFRLLSSSSYSMHQQTAIAVQADLKAVGIEVELELPDWATRMDRVGDKDYDMFVNAMSGDYSDPDWLGNFMESGEHTFNKSADFADAEVDRLLAAARSTIDETERQQLYEELIDRLLELCPHVYLCWREQTAATGANIGGFQQRPGYLANAQAGMTLEDVYFIS